MFKSKVLFLSEKRYFCQNQVISDKVMTQIFDPKKMEQIFMFTSFSTSPTVLMLDLNAKRELERPETLLRTCVHFVVVAICHEDLTWSNLIGKNIFRNTVWETVFRWNELHLRKTVDPELLWQFVRLISPEIGGVKVGSPRIDKVAVWTFKDHLNLRG